MKSSSSKERHPRGLHHLRKAERRAFDGAEGVAQRLGQDGGVGGGVGVQAGRRRRRRRRVGHPARAAHLSHCGLHATTRRRARRARSFPGKSLSRRSK